MSHRNSDKKEHFSARISPFLITRIRDRAEKERKSVTNIVEEAFLLYFKDELPGLCGSCRFMNEPTDRFCSRCGKPLVEEAWEEYFQNYEEFWKTGEYFDRLEKILKEHLEKSNSEDVDNQTN